MQTLISILIMIGALVPVCIILWMIKDVATPDNPNKGTLIVMVVTGYTVWVFIAAVIVTFALACVKYVWTGSI